MMYPKIVSGAYLSLFLYVLQFSILVCFTATSSIAHSPGNETDRLALLKFKQEIYTDPFNVLESWNDSVHFCNWFGITCSRRHIRIRSLDLQGRSLGGLISPYIGNLSFLTFINLQNNSLHGEIPKQVGNLFRLHEIYLNNNTLSGEIPANFSQCSKLRIISFPWNSLVGRIPEEIGSLSKLEELRLGANKLTGEIPASLANLSSLTTIYLAANNLHGVIPNDIGRLTKLVEFGFGRNNLSGMIPPLLYNISSLKKFYFEENNLTGSLPANMGHTLPNLHTFGMYGNYFSGPIPHSISNASQLQLFDIGLNYFTGSIPTNLGNLRSLWWLQVSFNLLGSNSTNDLLFVNSLTNCTKLGRLNIAFNNFGGTLPNSLANLSSQLDLLYLNDNQLYGPIPAALGNLVNLSVFTLENNLFTGNIPSFIGKFHNLHGLYLDKNSFSGHIPSFISNLSLLLELDLSQNKLEGSIPVSIGNCKNLYLLDVSQNNLTGRIPSEIFDIASLSLFLNLSHNSFNTLPMELGKLESINAVDFSENSILGEIPETIGYWSSLEHLYMRGNFFRGVIPSSLASLRGLQYLDLSRNNLSGKIPQDLQKLPFLRFLNLSFNDLEGEVPMEGIFKNANTISLTGNIKLCGGVPELHLPACPLEKQRQGKSLHFKLKIIVPCLGFLLLSLLLIARWLRNTKKKSTFAPSESNSLVKVSYKNLYDATSGFSSSNLLGSGSFGVVYKGFLDQITRPIAVKVITLHQEGASKSFMAECDALKYIRHRNLVKIITSCSSLDYKGNEFKALVFEFMENGSLEKWLYPATGGENQPRNLSLLQRINIAIDVASALNYLHDLCETPIIHCDLKPSNVLLDDDMVAHVSDFGIARVLLLATTASGLSQSKTSSIGVKGTVGYAAPEYGMGCAASKEGDVYSYGILVLEMFSGKRPTDEMFKDGLNLHDFVDAALPKRIMQVVDPSILQIETRVTTEKDNDNEIDEEEGINYNESSSQMIPNVRKCLLSVLVIGVACSSESPQQRMKMGDVSRKLQRIKSNFQRT